MRSQGQCLAAWFGVLCLLIVPLWGKESAKKQTADVVEVPAATSSEARELAKIDPKQASEGKTPQGSTVVRGTWTVSPQSKMVTVAPTPLVDAWLEFGPEIRQRGATIVALGRAGGKGKLQSRFGVGLYGKNGFQLRADAGKQQVELVRRGELLLKKEFSFSAESRCQLELSVLAERNHWIVSGRAWVEGESRPEESLFRYKVFSEELLFPLAGRSVLFATPFSGAAVEFFDARVYNGLYEPPQKEAVKPERKAEGAEAKDEAEEAKATQESEPNSETKKEDSPGSDREKSNPKESLKP